MTKSGHVDHEIRGHVDNNIWHLQLPDHEILDLQQVAQRVSPLKSA